MAPQTCRTDQSEKGLQVNFESFESPPSGRAYLKMIKWLTGKSDTFIRLENHLVKRDRSASLKQIIGLGIVTVMGSGLALRVAKSQPDAVNCFDLGSGLKQV